MLAPGRPYGGRPTAQRVRCNSMRLTPLAGLTADPLVSGFANATACPKGFPRPGAGIGPGLRQQVQGQMQMKTFRYAQR